MKRSATPTFWNLYRLLPLSIRIAANRRYHLWLKNPHHPSVRFKKINSFWSARVTDDYRALGIAHGDEIVWFWIGSHADYELMLKSS